MVWGNADKKVALVECGGELVRPILAVHSGQELLAPPGEIFALVSRMNSRTFKRHHQHWHAGVLRASGKTLKALGIRLCH